MACSRACGARSRDLQMSLKSSSPPMCWFVHSPTSLPPSAAVAAAPRCACAPACVCACVLACARAYEHVHVRAHVHVCAHVRTCGDACVRACVRVCVYVRTCACTRVHACTYICLRLQCALLRCDEAVRTAALKSLSVMLAHKYPKVACISVAALQKIPIELGCSSGAGAEACGRVTVQAGHASLPCCRRWPHATSAVDLL